VEARKRRNCEELARDLSSQSGPRRCQVSPSFQAKRECRFACGHLKRESDRGRRGCCEGSQRPKAYLEMRPRWRRRRRYSVRYSRRSTYWGPCRAWCVLLVDRHAQDELEGGEELGAVQGAGVELAFAKKGPGAASDLGKDDELRSILFQAYRQRLFGMGVKGVAPQSRGHPLAKLLGGRAVLGSWSSHVGEPKQVGSRVRVRGSQQEPGQRQELDKPVPWARGHPLQNPLR
jgi:hypothetical protein